MAAYWLAPVPYGAHPQSSYGFDEHLIGSQRSPSPKTPSVSLGAGSCPEHPEGVWVRTQRSHPDLHT